MSRFTLTAVAVLSLTVSTSPLVHALQPSPSVALLAGSGASDDDVSQLERALSKQSVSASGISRIEIKKIAFRPGGTAATLRQLGDRDSVRLIVHRGAFTEEIVVHQRAEGLHLNSAAARKEQLFSLCAKKVAKNA